MARNLFREQDDLEHLVNKITTESQGLMQCARCCVYIVDQTMILSNKPEVKKNVLFLNKNNIFSNEIIFKEIHFSKGFDMIYGEEFKVTTFV